MRITFDNVQANQTNHPAEQIRTSYGAAQSDRMSAVRGFALDISGKVMDNKAYEGHGRTTEDVMQMMGAIDVSVMRDYLTVMSNTMSAEDFQKMSKDGFDPTDWDAAESVTILDHIKAALLKGGTVVEGFTTDIDTDVLRDITGSESFANSLKNGLQKVRMSVDRDRSEEIGKTYEKARSLEQPDDAAVKYMVENGMPLSVDGLYQAEHSASGDGNKQGRGFYADDVSGYYSRKADLVDLKALEPQMQKVVEDAGLPVTAQTMDEAGWLVEKGIPLTPENLDTLHRIKEIVMPLSDELLARATAAAVADGKPIGSADLSEPDSMIGKAEALTEEVNSFTEADADLVADAGKKLNIRNLRHAAHQREKQEQKKDTAAGEDSRERLHARLVLARTQLIMTTQANLKLLQCGYSIETEDLEVLVDRLTKADQQIKEQIWDSEDMSIAKERQDLYLETRKVLEEIPYLPIDVVGAIAQSDASSLEQVYDQGLVLRENYTRASASYETMMTTPRRDLGDSIQKAFRNVDDILLDNMLEVNEMNRRAVRILGYNQMDITPEMINAVKSADEDLRTIIRKMTPAATLEVIRGGHDPLLMSIQELNDLLDRMPSVLRNNESSLGKFIYKLELKKEITEKERAACIGVFRLFRQIEKKDNAVVGTLLRNGMELTFSNLLSALRSRKKEGMDYTIDDSFGGLKATPQGPTITEQIGSISYYSKLASEVAAIADPQKIRDALEEMDAHSVEDLQSRPATFEQVASMLLQAQPDAFSEDAKQAEKAYRETVYEDLREAAHVSEEAIQKILDVGLDRTPNMFLAMEGLLQDAGAWYWPFQKERSKERETVVETADKFLQALENGEEVEEHYQQMTEQFKQELSQEMEQADSYLDLKALQNSFRQISILQSISGFGQYDVPITIEGEDALIHLTLHQEDGVRGQLDISFETRTLGSVEARFQIGSQGSGYIMCQKEEGAAYLRTCLEQIRGLVSGDVKLLTTPDRASRSFRDVQKFDHTSDIETKEKTNRELYNIAGKFIKILQGKY